MSGACGPFYDHILGEMDSNEGFVAVQERLDSSSRSRREYPPRPDRFDRVARRPEPNGCGRHEGRSRLNTAWIPFRDEGRAFYALIALGSDAPIQIRREATGLLDSLRFQSRDTITPRTSAEALPVKKGVGGESSFEQCPPQKLGPARANRVRVSGGATCEEAVALWQVAPSQGPYGAPQNMSEQGISGGWTCVAPRSPEGGLQGYCSSGTKEVRYVFY
jgi:hypothetical protein